MDQNTNVNINCNKFYREESRICPDCNRVRVSYGWCKFCESEYMRLTFTSWQSGNKFIDLLIQHTQINATQVCDYLEYISFDNIEIIECVGRGGFSSVYKGYWIDGPRWVWDEDEDFWRRSGPTKVALKRLDNSQNFSMTFLKQLEVYHNCLQNGSMADCFGITRDETGCFMFVMRYYENGNLYEYLDNNKGIISWRDIADLLWGIAGGLEKIHSEGLCHTNLHGGNLLIEDESVSTDAKVADIGLHGPADKSVPKDVIIGVLPFIDPQVILRNQRPNPASDIYSFGIIMWVLATGHRPYFNRAHDKQLAYEICFKNLRPEISEELKSEMPEEYRNLMNQCWDPLPENRPTATQLNKQLSDWITAICDDPNPSQISNSFGIAEEKRWESIGREIENRQSSTYIIHKDAIYFSRVIDYRIIGG
ncbi:kinase-like domain-containing protein [Gigaspora rosea]|uniref:Kinase-like domain-containing protein n=1 Tax=Gigaspora rosea TaxID=44941 RepID=A0A397UBL4_9GLOM|nr:kinase-like domain-containing protein [Gigaspora rosea]